MTGRFATCAAIAVAVAACGGEKKADETKAGTSTGSAAGSATGSADAPPRRAAITAKSLSPVVIHEIGGDGVVPTAIVIQLAAPVIDRSAIGSESPGVNLALSPAVPGALVHSGISELTFTPSKPFDFDKSYQVELVGVDSLDGTIAPPAGDKWTYAFKTPPFKMIRWTPDSMDLEEHKIAMDIAFSGPVLSTAAKAGIALAIDGSPPAGVAMQMRDAGTHVIATLTDPRIRLGAKLTLVVKPTLAAMTGAKAPATSAEYLVSADKAITIKTAAIAESSNGFYLEVVCDDAGSGRGNRAYYQDEGYYNLSERCQLADESIRHIHFDPPVKKTYLAGGRAGFRVFGDFKRGAYKVRIDGGATSIDGGVVLAAYSRSVSVPARKPQLNFVANGRYLPRSAWTNLGITHNNVDSANIVVRQVPAENLVFWLGETGDAATERTGNVILKKTIPLRGAPDATTTTWLDVASLLPATTKGVLDIKLVGVGTEASSRLLLTNMSLVAKKSNAPGKPAAQTVQVWALDIDSAELLGGVDMSLVRKSGKVVARCTTKGSDGCTLAARTDDDDDAVPFAVIARKGDDLTYIRYQDLRADVAESSTSGLPYVAETPYSAAIYPDRGVYRPGDTAHVVAIVRDAQTARAAPALPVDVKVIDPRTKVVKKVALKTNPAGVLALDQVFPAFADTGHWRVALSVADKPLASYDLQVEEFVPERMRVTATPKQAGALIGQKIPFDVNAQYLFGGSAVDSGVELSCAVEPEAFKPDENSDMTYGIPVRGKPVQLGQSRDQLDPHGHAAMTCPDPETATPFTGTTRLNATAAVLEAGSGRATVKSASVVLHPEKFYLGVKTPVTRAVDGQAFTVEGVVVDWNGKLAPQATGQVKVELAHFEGDYGYGYYDGGASYDYWMRPVPEDKLDVRVAGGKFTFKVTPFSAGTGYRIRVRAGKATTDLMLDGGYMDYDYGDHFGGGERYADPVRIDQTPRPTRPTQLALALPKEIKVGEPTAVSVRAPYRGKVLWTVETDHVVTAEWKDVAAGEATWSFTLAQFAPNAYVSAFVVKDPHLESKDAFMPDRAFGVASARVAATEFTQPLAIEAPRQVRSSSPLSITIDAGKTDGPAFATVAVVDEGILSLTNFASPDPLGQLFAKRALGIETYETIGWTMLHQPAGASSRTGGGDEGESDDGALGKSRVQPVKTVAMFSGVVAVGPDGKATIPFSVPQYRGQLRVMAVVVTPSRIGHAEAKVTVRDPLVVQVTFPRFVLQNDELEIPVFMTNMSGGPLEVAVQLKSELLAIPGLAPPRAPGAPINFAGKDSGVVKLADGFSETVVFRARAALAVGGAKLRVVARAKGAAGVFETKEDVDVPFLPAGPKERVVQRVKLEAGTLDLTARLTNLKGWVPTSESTTLWMTNNPFGESFQHLGYLMHYPYGCIEQTTSATRPLLYVANLVEHLDPQLGELKIEEMVLAGINRVLSMETPSGGFGYWPGATEPVDWGTAYATDMLLDAKLRGYAVPEDRLKEVLGWIEGRLAQQERSAGQPQSAYDQHAEAYLHYVLARAGKGKKARIQNLIAHLPATVKGEQAEDIYMLKAALYLAGDRRYEKDLKTLDTSPITDDRNNSWSFYSDRRRRGLQLSTFFDLFGNDPAADALAERVAETLSGHSSYYYTTQELVWGITGLGKWIAKLTGKGVLTATLTGDGTAIAQRQSKRKTTETAWHVMRASEYKKVALEVPAQAAGAWLIAITEGVRTGGDYKVGGDGMTIARTYRDAGGKVVDPGKGELKLGDLLFVEILVSNTSQAEIQNIALVDRLPAGFEIENPRLGRATKTDWITEDGLWPAAFMNARDDRLEAFGTLPAHSGYLLIYTVRAVTSGTFTIPPVEVGAMYDPRLWARQKGGTAVIGGPWTGKLL